MPSEPDHFLWRDHLKARDRDDHAEAANVWERLALNNWDRIQQIVKAFRFSAGGRGLPQDERGSAATEAYLRVIAMGPNFRKRHLGQYYAALVTTVEHACRDFGRKEFRHQKRSGGSIDQTFEPGGEAGPFDAALAAYDADLRRRSIDAVESELARQEDEGVVAWAIAQVQNPSYREVLELTYIHKLPAAEIAKQLGISMDNVYARRSRGLKELEKILRDLRS